MVCDGDVNYIQSTIDNFKSDGISIYTILIGTDLSGKSELEQISMEQVENFIMHKKQILMGMVFQIMKNVVKLRSMKCRLM